MHAIPLHRGRSEVPFQPEEFDKDTPVVCARRKIAKDDSMRDRHKNNTHQSEGNDGKTPPFYKN
jgi:hypothetical protein